MEAQPSGADNEPVEPEQQSPPAPPLAHEHVRTEGETDVDDALGAADDPR
ncbi:MAG: hypothetical protein ACXV4A_02010 [Actinomycetes bacterium]